MATVISATASNPCLKLQTDLAAFFSKNPSAEQTSTGAYDALTSAENTKNVKIVLDLPGDQARPTTTSVREIQGRYVPQIASNSMSVMTECSTDTVISPLWKTAKFTVDKVHTWGFDIEEADYREMCESKEENFAAFFMARYNNEKAALNAKIITPLVAAMGKYPITGNPSLVTPVNLPIVTSTGSYNPAGLALMQTHYNQMNSMETPIIVGAGKMDFAANALGYSGQSANGINAAGSSFKYYRDPAVNTVGLPDGFDNIVTWLPGSIQFIGWNDFVGRFEKFTYININGKQEVEKGLTTITTNDGIRWDVKMTYACGVYTWVFQKYFGINPLPSDAFLTATQNYNYALRYRLSCGDLTCAQIDAATGIADES